MMNDLPSDHTRKHNINVKYNSYILEFSISNSKSMLKCAFKSDSQRKFLSVILSGLHV